MGVNLACGTLPSNPEYVKLKLIFVIYFKCNKMKIVNPPCFVFQLESVIQQELEGLHEMNENNNIISPPPKIINNTPSLPEPTGPPPPPPQTQQDKPGG